MGLTPGKAPLIAPAPRGILDPRTGKPVGANDPTFLAINDELGRQGLSRHRAPTISSTGRAPVR